MPSSGWWRYLNPGPFNIKEHTVITVMSNVVYGGAYATEIIAAQRVFYAQSWGFGYQILLGVGVGGALQNTIIAIQTGRSPKFFLSG